jgi:hypothetical protein
MRTWVGVLISLGLLAALPPARASAQQPGSPSITRPTVSPYLNLLRNDQPTYLNYYGLVRPQVDFRGSIGQLQQQTTADQQAISNLGATPGLSSTGHAVGFGTQYRYYMTLGRTGGSGFRPGIGGGVGGLGGGVGGLGGGAGTAMPAIGAQATTPTPAGR